MKTRFVTGMELEVGDVLVTDEGVRLRVSMVVREGERAHVALGIGEDVVLTEDDVLEVEVITE